MADQPVARMLARHGTGGSMDMVAVVLRCGCVLCTDVQHNRIDAKARTIEGGLPCPAGHRVRPTPRAARCPECGTRLGGEVRDCDSGDGHFGWTGEPPCSHINSALQQLRLEYGSHPWRKKPGWYCMGCSLPPR